MLKLALMGFADGLVLTVGRKASRLSLHLGKRIKSMATEWEVVENESPILDILSLRYLLDLQLEW